MYIGHGTYIYYVYGCKMFCTLKNIIYNMSIWLTKHHFMKRTVIKERKT